MLGPQPLRYVSGENVEHYVMPYVLPHAGM